MAMVRKQIYIEKSQDEALKREAKRQGVTEAAVIRESIDERLAKAESGGAEAAERLLQLIRDWHAKKPQGGFARFDRESLYER